MCMCLSASVRVKTRDAVLHDEWVPGHGTQMPAITVGAELLPAGTKATYYEMEVRNYERFFVVCRSVILSKSVHFYCVLLCVLSQNIEYFPSGNINKTHQFGPQTKLGTSYHENHSSLQTK